MGATLNPRETFVAYLPSGEKTAAADTLRYLKPGSITFRPQNGFIVYVPSGIKTAEAGTARHLMASEECQADTRRTLEAEEMVSAPLRRILARTETAAAETIRDTTSFAVISPRECFLAFVPSGIQTASADTERGLYWRDGQAADTRREIYLAETASAPAVRDIFNSSRPDVAEAGTVRSLFSMRSAVGDSSRFLYSRQTACAATVRIPVFFSRAGAEAVRHIYKTDRARSDTARRIPCILRGNAGGGPAAYTSAGIQTVAVSLEERTLSDGFQLTSVKSMAIGTPIKGRLLDHDFSFLVEETSQQGLVQTIRGMYDVDAMLYTPFHVTAGGTMCSTYVRQIAGALGLKLVSSFEDYEMDQDYSESGLTYRDLITSLFGWTSRLPQRQINVFIRGDTLHVLQRGMEDSVLDISDWPHTMPVISRRLVRSLWDNRKEDDDLNSRAHSEVEDDALPFSGVIGVGKVTRRYANGYLVHETNNGDEISYSYNGEYLHSKTCRRKDGTVIRTAYEYYRTRTDIYLMTETEVTDTSKVSGNENADESETVSTRTTYHAPVGGGWYLTSVYADKEFEGSSLSQGPPGGKVTPYMVNAMNRHLSGSIGRHGEPIRLNGTALIDTSFPVKGDMFLRQLTLAIEWLNRKVREDVSLEIVSNVRGGLSEIAHVVDFTERIRLDGEEYYLVSNQVELTPRSLRQKLKLVRWYG